MKKFIRFAGNTALNWVMVAAYDLGNDVFLVAEDPRKGSRAVLRANGTPAIALISREEWENRPVDAYDETTTLAWAFRKVGLHWPGDEEAYL